VIQRKDVPEPKLERAPSPARRSPAERPLRSIPRILLVVPDPVLREQTEAALSATREVTAVGDASSALAALAEGTPDVVLADVAAGADVVRALRADARPS
jgi:CheY-like chemotaxis protein